MPLQTELDNALNQVVNNFTGQRIAMPNGLYHGECTAPIVWYLTYMNQPIPPMHNARADGWGVANPSELMPFWDFERYQPGTTYPRGTILMWDSPHIAIVIQSNGSNTVTVFEQNADPDHSPCATKSRTLNLPPWHQATYAMVPRIYAPSPPPPPAIPYTLQVIPTKQIRINKDTHRWNVAYNSFNDMVANPVGEVVTNGTVFTISALAHNSAVNYDYYLEDTGNLGGFNVLDCDDYTPPPPVQVVVSDTSKTQGALPITKAEKYDLLTSVVSYNKAADAQNDQNGVTALKEGSYYIYSRDLGMLNLTKDNMKAGVWINPKQNVLAPIPPAVRPTPVSVPAPAPTTPPPISAVTTIEASPNLWKTTNTALRLDRKPVNYLPNFEHDIEITELNTGHTFTLSSIDDKGMLRVLPVVSVFWKNGVEYARTWKVAQDGEWWGIPMSALEEEIFYTGNGLVNRFVTKTTKFGDMMPLAIAKMERFISDIKKRKK